MFSARVTILPFPPLSFDPPVIDQISAPRPDQAHASKREEADQNDQAVD
jgi:hypothetical protein